MKDVARRCLVLLLGAALVAESAASGILGDADSDGDVDGDDVIAVQTEFGSVGATPLLGDADCDGDVDSDDLLVVNSGIYYGGLPDVGVTFEFSDPDLDEIFDVYFSTLGTGSAGLAFYSVVIEGLEGGPITPSSIVWEENTLGNFNEAFDPRGIQSDSLIASPIGANSYSATNTQIASANPLFGIGQIAIDEPDNPVIPTDEPVQLGVPALLGQLTIPGFYDLPREEGLALLRPDTLLFSSEGNSAAVESPSAVNVVLTGMPILKGDADGDGDIDGDDLIAVQTNFGATSDGSFPLLGDADFDGDVDGDDLIIVQSNFGAVAAVAVPEPATAALLCLAISATRRRRNGRR